MLLVFTNLLFSCSSPQITLQSPSSSLQPYDVPASYDVDLSVYNDITLPPVGDASVVIRSSTEDSGETVAPMRQGQAAPFPGVLFNGPAVARIEVEFRGQQEQCRIDRQADLQRLSARAVADIRLLQTTVDTITQSYTLRLRNQQEELNQVYRIARGNTPTSPWMYVGLGVGGFALGILTSLLVVIGLR